MLTLKDSILLAGDNLLATLAPSQGYLPFWGVNLDSNGQAECQIFWPSHNVGRWWDAMLRLESVTGFKIPADLENRMVDNLKQCLDNPLKVNCHLIPRIGLEPGPDPAGWFDDHSQREVLLALADLVRFRHQPWANELGSHMVRALDGYIQEDGNWDYVRMGEIVRQAGIPVSQALIDYYRKMTGFRLVESTGRLIEALLEFYTASGDEIALKLASRLAQHHLEVSTKPDGSHPAAEHIHTHSYLGTLRGLLMYGQLTRQHEYIERVAKTYLETVIKTIKQTGFLSHDLGKEKDGETGSVGDVVQLALRLAQSGYPEFLDDAERIVRARLLPSQISETIGLQPLVDDGKDEHSDLDKRTLGAFGGLHYQTHGGKHPFTDITAADLHSLCDFYAHIVENSPLGLQVNFHFDYEDDRIRIQCSRHEQATLSILLKAPQPLLIRIPGWTPAASVRLKVNAQAIPLSWVGHFLYIPQQAGPAEIQVEYDLPLSTLDETTDGVTYHVQWRGDEITSISPNVDWLPFYPNL